MNEFIGTINVGGKVFASRSSMYLFGFIIAEEPPQATKYTWLIVRPFNASNTFLTCGSTTTCEFTIHVSSLKSFWKV